MEAQLLRPDAPVAEGGPGGPLVVVVAEEPSIRRRVTALVRRSGYDAVAFDHRSQPNLADAELWFRHALIELRPGRDNGLALVTAMRRRHRGLRLVVFSARDSFASVAPALRAGADDYLPWPLDEEQLAQALSGSTPADPPVPETPLALTRVVWEHVQRAFERCDRNVTWTAAHLGMHRRTLQRVLGKRSPPLRARQSGPSSGAGLPIGGDGL